MIDLHTYTQNWFKDFHSNPIHTCFLIILMPLQEHEWWSCWSDYKKWTWPRLQWLWQVWEEAMNLAAIEGKLFKFNCYSLNWSCFLCLYICFVINCWIVESGSLYLLFQNIESHCNSSMVLQSYNFQCHSLIYLITLSPFSFIIGSTVLLYSVLAQSVPFQGLVQWHASHLSL